MQKAHLRHGFDACQVWSNVTTTDRSTLQPGQSKNWSRNIENFTTILYLDMIRYDNRTQLDALWMQFGQVAGARCPAKCQSSKELLRNDLQGIEKVTWEYCASGGFQWSCKTKTMGSTHGRNTPPKTKCPSISLKLRMTQKLWKLVSHNICLLVSVQPGSCAVVRLPSGCDQCPASLLPDDPQETPCRNMASPTSPNESSMKSPLLSGLSNILPTGLHHGFIWIHQQ